MSSGWITSPSLSKFGDTEDNLQKAVYLLYNISKEHNLEIATKKVKVFGFVGTDHLRT